MLIRLITPKGTINIGGGNHATAERWAGLLGSLGHEVAISDYYQGEPADLMIALHAWKSAEAIHRYRAIFPDSPLIVALTGTDIYRYQQSDPEVTHRSMQLADGLIGLHERVADDIDPAFGDKLQVVLQSALAPLFKTESESDKFEICQIGHLREEKDPFRLPHAVRDLPDDSRLHVVHAGSAHSDAWAQQAEEETARNPRYHWLGNLDRDAVWTLMARCDAMVISSISEGGANVVSEACVAGLPVLASRIPGNVGLLGGDYPGYFPVGDTVALQQLLIRLENDASFFQQLRNLCRARAPLFTPDAERASLQQAIERCITPG
ncbi:selenoneine biosynthesis selenosugar synthase SenB [Marinobacter fonticola]|uniref:selenoneine biosynthesis selenosugar synthase SenB n=1 Tax=Marinobacter fonticola TaxID=2603215 RepID=UPI0011E85901|nr:selenoneine biosynthesis selenosugar synthase SenB [Marinobacter fonticola]